MFEPDSHVEPDDAALERLYRRSPGGALMIAGIGAAGVFVLWFAFYLLIFLPRGLLR